MSVSIGKIDSCITASSDQLQNGDRSSMSISLVKSDGQPIVNTKLLLSLENISTKEESDRYCSFFPEVSRSCVKTCGSPDSEEGGLSG